MSQVQAATSEMKTLANEFVNMVFWGTMMKEFRGGQEPGLLGNGPGSKTFVEMLDNEMVKRMSSRGDNPLAESLLRQLGASGRPAVSRPVNTLNGEVGHE